MLLARCRTEAQGEEEEEEATRAGGGGWSRRMLVGEQGVAFGCHGYSAVGFRCSEGGRGVAGTALHFQLFPKFIHSVNTIVDVSLIARWSFRIARAWLMRYCAYLVTYDS